MTAGAVNNVATKNIRCNVRFGKHSVSLTNSGRAIAAHDRSIFFFFFFFSFSFRVSSGDKRVPIDRDRATSRVVTNTATKLFAFTSYRINTRSIQTCFFGRGLRSALRMIPLSLSSPVLDCSGILPSHRVHVYQVGNAAPISSLDLCQFDASQRFLRDSTSIAETHRNVDTRRLCI